MPQSRLTVSWRLAGSAEMPLGGILRPAAPAQLPEPVGTKAIASPVCATLPLISTTALISS